MTRPRVQSSLITPRIITSRLHSTCKLCGGKIAPGEQVLYHPLDQAHLSVKRKSYVTHLDGECAQPHTVKCIYHATSKEIMLNAHDAAEAAVAAKRIACKRNPVSKPRSYVVYQGNVAVLEVQA